MYLSTETTITVQSRYSPCLQNEVGPFAEVWAGSAFGACPNITGVYHMIQPQLSEEAHPLEPGIESAQSIVAWQHGRG